MQPTYWTKQTTDAPLYPDMLWSRPENRTLAGKLLIIGGNVHGFVAPGKAYQAATVAGAGTVRLYLPDSLQKLLGKAFAAGEFGPTTPSGSFAQLALGEALAMAHWADATLLAGDLGRNSETAIFLEKFAHKYAGQLTITKDAADYFISSPSALLERPDTVLVISMAQLQKLAVSAKHTTAFTYDMDILRFVDALHTFTHKFAVALVVKHHDSLFVSVGGRVSSTKLAHEVALWRVQSAARIATWWMQNPSKTFEALTTALAEPLDSTL